MSGIISIMKVIKEISRMQEYADHLRDKGDRIGFVPTMGFLHEGHRSLLKRATEENHALVVSIFVNPLQFGPGEDYRLYPRDADADMDFCRGEGCDVLFTPAVREMYPGDSVTRVSVPDLTEGLCGTSRPGHFDGVATVVAKLFHAVKPERAYFGLKDYQQLKVIERMVRDLNMNVEVVGLPTIRDGEGLALSSRNSYLTGEERGDALALPRSVDLARRLFSDGVRDAKVIQEAVKGVIQSGPRNRIDYVSVVDPETLRPMDTIGDRALLALAVYVGKARLIDNTILGEDGQDVVDEGMERTRPCA